MRFSDMGLAPEILRAIREAGYETPTPIQEQSIPILLEGRDIMGCAQTGTGKTAAFAIPILQRLKARVPGKTIRAVILVPTRELAIQVGDNIRAYAVHLDLRTTSVYGGVPIPPQEKALREGVDILVATPGRLFDHMWRANIDYRDTEVLVLDEADRMLDMGFYDDVMAIVNEIPTARQSMLFSATLSPEIRKLARGILRDPASVEAAPPATTVEEVEQVVIHVESPSRKREVLDGLIRKHRMQRALIFTRTKRGASALSSFLKSRGYRATSIHSDKTQEARVAALEGFRAGRVHLLVATDIAARGIDVDGIEHVINFDVPHSPDDYVHRIGRTARAGRRGVAISIVSPIEQKSFDVIEKRIGGAIPAGRSRREDTPPVAPAPPAVVEERVPPRRNRNRRRRKAVPAGALTMSPSSPSSSPSPSPNGRAGNGHMGNGRTGNGRAGDRVPARLREVAQGRPRPVPNREPLLQRVVTRVRSMIASSS